ncbi:CPBP family intramembrane glutamic endopeptidase [Pseudoalteromonas umbrosa]|uniref:CPBP family intramembrane glutamic endopeptidase n=1 Tax=Pseudoalteromonas umbrosa TaxID=3048489 RepID=UPI0024C27361|nr:CPBP family intramembrane metalloprotease [Pseudoalteromonas sp. B95]MDK1286311.1 CPBP family intramembrane metalloprotease [Pseudoalteromonas sp. B95]
MYFATADILQLYSHIDLKLVDDNFLDPNISPQDDHFIFYMCVLFVSLVIVVPIFAEVVYRGVLLDRLYIKLSPLWAIALSSLLYGSMHNNYIGSLILGIILCLIRFKYRTLAAPIFIHMLHNLIVYGLILTSYFVNLSCIPIISGLVSDPNIKTIAILLSIATLIIGTYCYYVLRDIPKNKFKKRTRSLHETPLKQTN